MTEWLVEVKGEGMEVMNMMYGGYGGDGRWVPCVSCISTVYMYKNEIQKNTFMIL
jgi:hypothetical protein